MLAGAGLALVAATAACTAGAPGGSAAGTTLPAPAPGAELADLPAPPPTLPVPEGFVAPDTRTVILQPVIGRYRPPPPPEEPTLPVVGGKARLSGIVVGPDGPVDGATVRLERFVGEQWGEHDVTTDADGEWEAFELFGGRYRVRAWLKPSLATVEPQATFLKDDGGAAELGLTVEKHEGLVLQGAVDAVEPHVGERVAFKTLLAREEVNDDGVVVATGVGLAEVAITPVGAVRVVGSSVATTDADGFANFIVMCTATGGHSIIISSSGLALAVGTPDCAEGVVPPDDTGPVLVDLPVGSAFTVPAVGPFPPGTYAATNPGNCSTTYEEWNGAVWARTVTLDRTILTAYPIRGLLAVTGSNPCTFRRTA